MNLLKVVLVAAGFASAASVPMEPASRTLFVFVHGINPKCSGAEENISDADAHKSMSCESGPLVGDDAPVVGPFCVDRSELLGKAGQVWLKNLDGNRDNASLFCSLNEKLFADGQYSLRSFSNPGSSPVALREELGRRDWSQDVVGSYLSWGTSGISSVAVKKTLRSHVAEAMLRFVNHRRMRAQGIAADQRTSFESKLVELYPDNASIENLKPIFDVMPDSMPSRMIVFAHSMGGLTTREYLMSDFYNDDVDKVVTFDSPQEGSWIAHYNKGGSVNWPVAAFEPAVKALIAVNLLATTNPIADHLAVYFTYSAASHLATDFATQFSGVVGNHFVGNEAGNYYLTPGSSELMSLNSKNRLPCEADGCIPPRFVVNAMDGGLAPADPEALVGGSSLAKIVPLDQARELQAVVMALGRDWPSSLSASDVAANALAAGVFAQGNWNMSQHGSLVVPHSSSWAGGIPFLNRPDVVLRKRDVVFNEGGLAGAAGEIASAGTDIALGMAYVGSLGSLTAQTLSQLSMLMGVFPPGSAEWLGLYGSKIGVALSFGGKAGIVKTIAGTAGMAGYASMAAPSHNASIWESATKEATFQVTRADNTVKSHVVHQIENDLYENPFAQVKTTRIDRMDPSGNANNATFYCLHINGKNACDDPNGLDDAIAVAADNLSQIQYSLPGWDERWALRVESHENALQGSDTKVRKIQRYNLPLELLTTKDISSLDLQVDDLRPDLMEKMSLSINWGLQTVVWDRDDDGSYTVTVLENGVVSTRFPPLQKQANPIDAYGTWHIDLLDHFSKPVLLDGQNLLAISLTNHVGKSSVQRQFITWQATPAVVNMWFPQPWEVVSTTSAIVDARFSFLFYPRMQFDAGQTGWKIESRNPYDALSEAGGFQSIPGLDAGAGEFSLLQSLGSGMGASPLDGAYGITFQLGTHLASAPGSVTKSYRSIPFTLDRTAPVLTLDAPTEIQAPGKPVPFGLVWTDLPSSRSPVLEIVRAWIKDANGKIVSEMSPVPFVAGGQLPLQWDGKSSSGKNAADGTYTLQVEACDGAVPDAATRDQLLALRGRLKEEASHWGGLMSSESDDVWNRLRERSDLNWASATTTFRIDGTAPEVVLGSLPSKPVGKGDLLRINLEMADAVSTGMDDSVSVRLTFHPVGATVETEQVVDTVFTSLASSLSDAPSWSFGENEGALGCLPDGDWALSVRVVDPAGNRLSRDLPGTITVDRSAPVIRSLRADHLMVSSASIPTGKVVLSVSDAETVQAEWVAPDGTTVPATTSFLGGLWTASYPDDLAAHKGAWTFKATVIDAAGNSTKATTVVWVDLAPPRIGLLNEVITGPVVLVGIAGDVAVDKHSFRSYALHWRESGSDGWRTDGLRVPSGRGEKDRPWVSSKAQAVQGVLGSWIPPAGLAGQVEFRVVVDDGTNELGGHEAVHEAYVSALAEPGFHVVPAIGEPASAVQSWLGFDITSSEDQTAAYGAQVAMTDEQGSFLFAQDAVELRASKYDGTPKGVVAGAFQVWRDDGKWHLRANRLCRAYTVNVLARSSEPVPVACPEGWTCEQKEISATTLPEDAGGILVDRSMSFQIPIGRYGEIGFALENPAQVNLIGDVQGGVCSEVASTCGESMSARSNGNLWPLPMPGEVVTGASDQVNCLLQGAYILDPGRTSWKQQWNGFRQDGTYAAPGAAKLDVLVWNTRTGRFVEAMQSAMIAQNQAVLHAWSDGEIGISAETPSIQRNAAVRFTLEGRRAKLNLAIEKDGVVVRRLAGDGGWFEGRPITRPYTASWDGRNEDGELVEPGEYAFHVSEVDGTATSQAVVNVTGTAWQEDPALSLNFPEGQWNSDLDAYLLQPQPWLGLSMGIEGDITQARPFTYLATWSGRQLATMFPQKRFSLMVNRRRESVKFGIMFHGIFEEEAFDTDQDFFCEDGYRSDLHGVNEYTDVQVIEIQKGGTGVATPTFHVHGDQNSATYEFKLKGQKIEYMIVPLSQVEFIKSAGTDKERWDKAIGLYLTRGSFSIDQYYVNDWPRPPSLATTVRPVFGTTSEASAVGLNAWIATTPPVACSDVLARFGDAAHKGTQDWNVTEDPCNRADATWQDVESVNPHRNLVEYSLTNGGNQVGLLRWQDGNVTNDCDDVEHKNAFSFRMKMRVPDAYWAPQAGINNLANRFLRFDSENSFLYGDGGYLKAVDATNPEALDGHITAVESRTFRWRPRLSGILHQEERYGTPPSGTGPARLASVDPNGGIVTDLPLGFLFKEWDAWDDADGTSDDNAQFPYRGDANKDPLYFYEGDHSKADETMEAWFENSPEQGLAPYIATITQGGVTQTLSSAANLGQQNRKSFAIKRGSGTGIRVNGTLNWTPVPLDIRVAMGGGIDDLALPDLAEPLPWPLNSANLDAAVRAAEASCASRISAGCKLYKAASGIRFGIDDGLVPTLPGYASLAQQQYFEQRKSGLPSDPDALPAAVAGATGTLAYTGRLEPDASGSLSYVDNAHFRVPASASADWGALTDLGVAVSLPQEPSVSAHVDPDGSVLFRESNRGRWSFKDDPRSGGAPLLEVGKLWNGTRRSQDWSLLDLYVDAVGERSAEDQAKALFVRNGGWSRNPGLFDAALTNPVVTWRDGRTAASAFDIAPMNLAQSWPAGVVVSRKANAWGLPEWTPVHGYVKAGESYSLGWMGSEGGWNALVRSTSTCDASEASTGRCLLGMVDAARLPSAGRLGIVVEGAPRRFRLLPYAHGTIVGDGGSAEVRSLFGEASVVFGPGAMAGKTLAERTVTVRSVSSADAGMAYAGNLSVVGPVVEVRPSQAFSDRQELQPRVALRLSPRDLASGQDVSTLALYKVDAAEGTLVPLPTSVRTLCGGLACDASAEPDAVELTASTPTFSMFAALPKGLVDSRLWSLAATPARSRDARRILSISGIDASDVDWYLGAASRLRDPEGVHDAKPIVPVPDGSGALTVSVPVGSSWLFAVPRDGGLAKSVALERFEESFLMGYDGPDTVVAGTVNGVLRLPYSSNRDGRVSVALGEGLQAAFLSDSMTSPRGVLRGEGELLGYRWNGSTRSRLIGEDAEGATRTVDGPEIVGDGTVPWSNLVAGTSRRGSTWILSAVAQGGDAEGALDSLVVTVQTAMGRVLGRTSTSADRTRLEIELSGDSIPGEVLQVVAQAIDRGGNHAESSQMLDLREIAAHSVWWTEAESLAPRSSWIPVCELPSRMAVASDSVRSLRWPLPAVGAPYLLAGRWRSSDSARVEARLNSRLVGTFVLPPRPLWSAVEVLDAGRHIDVRAGDTLELQMPAGMQWDGVALVDDMERLASWHAPAADSIERAEVWIRDEAPADPNMSHPRFYVRNASATPLHGYALRYRVRAESGRVPVFEGWWPLPLSWRWATDGQGLWDLILDRTDEVIAPGGTDFGSDGLAMGLHYDPYSRWNSLDDPSWIPGTPQERFVPSRRIPVFDSAGALISAWECADPQSWVSASAEAAQQPVVALSNAPGVMDGVLGRYSLAPVGTWSWQSTILGFSPLDGRPMTGAVLKVGDQSWELDGWWQQVALPNPLHSEIFIELRTPTARRIQIQKWEN